MIPITCTFTVWGLDLPGPFKKAPEGLTHLLVVIDKFTKWIEAKPLAKIGSEQAIDFIQDIIFYFRVLNSIITDNGTQFTEERFLNFYDDNNIHVDWAVVAHPHTNGQVEQANDMILQDLKPCILTQEGEDVHTRLSTRARKWTAKVPSVLWSMRMMPNRSTNFTPSWYMGRRPYYPLTYNMGPPGFRPMNWPPLKKTGGTPSTYSRNLEIQPL
jgi:hypothetical protein